MPQNKRHFTILIVPDRQTKVRKLVVPHRLGRIAFGVLAFVLLAVLSMTFGFFHYRSLYVGDGAMRVENQRYRFEMEQVRNKVASIETYLDRIRRFDKKIRSITNLEDTERHVALGPIEGSVSETLSGEMVAALSPDFRTPDLGGSSGSKRAVEKFDDLGHSLDQMEQEAAGLEGSLQDLENKLQNMGAVLRYTPAVSPAMGWVTSNFGFRMSPFSGSRTMHEGMDIAASPGTSVKSPADGIVTFVGPMGNFGKTVVINHGYGTVTRYGHLAESYVRLGDSVKRGDRIAAIGNTGRSTGPHLHYEVVVEGIPRDPRKYILD